MWLWREREESPSVTFDGPSRAHVEESGFMGGRHTRVCRRYYFISSMGNVGASVSL